MIYKNYNYKWINKSKNKMDLDEVWSLNIWKNEKCAAISSVKDPAKGYA